MHGVHAYVVPDGHIDHPTRCSRQLYLLYLVLIRYIHPTLPQHRQSTLPPLVVPFLPLFESWFAQAIGASLKCSSLCQPEGSGILDAWPTAFVQALVSYLASKHVAQWLLPRSSFGGIEDVYVDCVTPRISRSVRNRSSNVLVEGGCCSRFICHKR